MTENMIRILILNRRSRSHSNNNINSSCWRCPGTVPPSHATCQAAVCNLQVAKIRFESNQHGKVWPGTIFRPTRPSSFVTLSLAEPVAAKKDKTRPHLQLQRRRGGGVTNRRSPKSKTITIPPLAHLVSLVRHASPCP